MNAIAIVRIRGHINTLHTIKKTLDSLNLTRANHCVIVPETPEFRGMIRMVKDYVTYGPIEAGEVETLIRDRGRLVGDKPLTDAYVKENTSFASIKELAAAVADGAVLYKTVPGVKPLFRLNPPRKGFKGGTKRSYQAHGALGDRGAEIGELLTRMI